MSLYYVFILCEGKWLLEGNKTDERVRKIVEGYNGRKSFLFCGSAIKQSEIEQILIYSSENSISEEFILPNGKRLGNTRAKEILDYIVDGSLKGFFVSTYQFNLNPQDEMIGRSKEKVEAKTEVFIVHGRDDKQALLLQKHLRDDLDIHARMFEDFKKKAGSTTIIEQLEYIWKLKAGYAFVVATPDDLGVLHEEFEKSMNALLRGKEKIEAEKVCKLLEDLKTRARQNVVFEFGLFMGALGRGNVCCLLQEGTQERPSDIDGILYTSFSKSVDEKFGEIDSKLKNLQAKKA